MKYKKIIHGLILVMHTANLRKKAAKTAKGLWFAYSSSEGWVVLDRTLAVNQVPDFPEDYIFTRCEDGKRYVQGDAKWDYQEAECYLENLPQGQATQLAQSLDAWTQAYAA